MQSECLSVSLSIAKAKEEKLQQIRRLILVMVGYDFIPTSKGFLMDKIQQVRLMPDFAGIRADEMLKACHGLWKYA